MNGRLRVVAAMGVAISALTACAALVDFGAYDTGEGPARDGGVDASVDFELGAPDSVRVEPGTSATLTVSIQRTSGPAQAVTIGVADPLPDGLDAVVPATVDASATMAVLTLRARANAPAGARSLRLVALADDVRKTKETLVSFRGLACTPDLGFGEGRGVIATAARLVGIPRGLGIASAGDQIVFGVAGDDQDVIVSVDQGGAPRWRHVDESPLVPLRSLALEPLGTVLLAGGHDILRLDGNGRAASFGGLGGSGVSTATTVIARPPPQLSLLGVREPSSWDLLERSSDGSFTSYGAVVLTPYSSADGGAPQATFSAAGIVGCGTTTDAATTFATLVRFAPVGTGDPAFGSGGRAVLGAGTSLTGCTADDAGVVGIGASSAAPLLLAVTPSGALDATFGDAGYITLPPVHGGPPSQPLALTAIALDRSALLAAATPDDGAHLLRKLRDGRPDSAFAASGDCALAPLRIGAVLSMTVTSDGKVLVLGTPTDGSTDTAILARLWL